jgi:hypothetical protein
MAYLESKSGSIEETVKNLSKHMEDSAYQTMFKKELEKTGKGIGAMTPKEKKDFFNMIDKKYTKEVKEEDAYDKDDEKPKSKPKKEQAPGMTMSGVSKTKVDTEPKITYNK